MTRYSYRWVLARKAGQGYAAHLCLVELVDGHPTYVEFAVKKEEIRRALFEANAKDIIKREQNGMLHILRNQRPRLRQCRSCGGFMFMEEAVRGDTHIGCGQLITIRSGNAKQGDKPFRQGVSL